MQTKDCLESSTFLMLLTGTPESCFPEQEGDHHTTWVCQAASFQPWFLIYIHPRAALRLSCQPSLLSIAPGSAWETSLRIHHFPGYPEEGQWPLLGAFCRKNLWIENTSLLNSQTFSNLWLQGSLVPGVILSTCNGPSLLSSLAFLQCCSDPHKHLASTTPNGKETSR